MGVWIETPDAMISRGLNPVTPCVGVWIETVSNASFSVYCYVTPCVGVWIETIRATEYLQRWKGHTLRGCVD